MSRRDKLFTDILSGRKDHDIPFSALCRLLERLGFICRVRGSHHVFRRPDIQEIVCLQPKGARAKDYQVKQVRDMLTKYGLEADEDELL